MDCLLSVTSKHDLQQLEDNAEQPEVCAELAEKQNDRRQLLSLARGCLYLIISKSISVHITYITVFL